MLRPCAYLMTRLSPYYLILGEVLRPHGVRGEVRMKIRTEHPERLLQDVKTVYVGKDPLQPDATPHSIKAARFHKDYLLLHFQDVNNRDAADTLRGQLVMIGVDDAIPLEEDEFYLYEVLGLTVQTDAGEKLGTVSDIIETGANDVYVVKSRSYGKLLIPAHEETIVQIDFEEGIILVSLPDGLLPDKKD